MLDVDTEGWGCYNEVLGTGILKELSIIGDVGRSFSDVTRASQGSNTLVVLVQFYLVYAFFCWRVSSIFLPWMNLIYVWLTRKCVCSIKVI